MERYDEALTHLEKALHMATPTGEESEIGKIYGNMGFIHERKGVLAQAEAIFRRFSSFLDLGTVYLKQKKWEGAREYLEAALATCRTLKNEPGEIKALLMMVEYELARGNQAQATLRLKAVEALLWPHRGKKPYQYLEALFLKY